MVVNARVRLAVALALATLAVYARTVGFGFTQLDDQIYVYKNHFVLDGLTAQSISWAFRTFYAANWHPLTWLSLMLDAQFGGSAPAIEGRSVTFKSSESLFDSAHDRVYSRPLIVATMMIAATFI